VVAADGRLSRVRRWSGISASPPRRRRFGLRRHFRIVPWSQEVEVYWADEGEAYVTPVAPDVVGIAVLSEARPLDFDVLIGLFPELSARLDGVLVLSRDRGAGPFGQRPETVFRERLALVGDASGCLDPITGEGLSLAFGEAHAVVRSLQAQNPELYVAEHRRLTRWPRLLTQLLLAVERRPRLRRRAIRGLSASPRVFSWLVDRVGQGGL
jgi:flavin-dependent dehydrogenase